MTNIEVTSPSKKRLYVLIFTLLGAIIGLIRILLGKDIHSPEFIFYLFIDPALLFERLDKPFDLPAFHMIISTGFYCLLGLALTTKKKIIYVIFLLLPLITMGIISLFGIAAMSGG